MPITLKKDVWKVKDPSSGQYRGAAILSTTLPQDAAQIISESNATIQNIKDTAIDAVDMALNDESTGLIPKAEADRDTIDDSLNNATNGIIPTAQSDRDDVDYSLNNINNGIIPTAQANLATIAAAVQSQISQGTDKTLSVAKGFADAKAAGMMVKVSNYQPGSALDDPATSQDASQNTGYPVYKDSNRVWVKETYAELEVPTMDDVDDLKSALDDVIEINGNLFDKTDVDLRELYLNNSPNNMRVSNVSATPARLIVIPIENNTDYVVNLKYGTSTKRVATTVNDPANNVPIDNALEFVGEINNCIIHNTTGNYLCIQLFITADTDKTASNYYDYVQVLVEGKLYTAVDIVAREKVTELNEKVDGLDVDNLKDKTQNTIISLNLFDKTDVDLRELYLNNSPNNMRVSNVSATPARLIVIPIENNTDYVVNLKYGTSTKRVATTVNDPANNVPIDNALEFVGEINNCIIHNTTGNYLCIQLFITADTDKTASNYYDYIKVVTENGDYTAVDVVAREKISELQTQTDSIEQTANNNKHEIDTLKGQIPQYFFTENLSGLPILNSMTDVIVDANTWDNSADFHAMAKTLCDNSDGYITQHLMGEDAHSNEMYYYRTHPKLIYYDCDRESVAPAYPPAGGYTVKPFRIIITSNIHYREKNGNYVMYNLLQKMLSADSGMLKFFYNNCEFIWIPCCCPSANEPDGYINADGQNVNRSFPTTKDGVATCPEAVLIKTVFDEFGDTADIHLDLHTFGSNSNFVTWLFTDNLKLGARGARIAEDVLQEYRAKYPHSVLPTQALNRSGGGFINTPTTSSYYMEKVYGIPAGTIEIQREIGTSAMDFNTKVTNATAVFYDLVTQTLIGMVR